MSKKCPPGVICIENITMIFVFILLFVIFYLIYVNFLKDKGKPQNQTNIVLQERNPDYWFSKPHSSYTNLPGDVLMNPYVPPLRDERYIMADMSFIPGRVPINVSTNVGAVDTSYRQVGILTPLHDKKSSKILPLMGRPLFVNHDKWQYYTMSDQKNSMKLPILRKGKSCTNEYGCDKIYGGDTVYVEGYKEAFSVTIYDNDIMKYIPFI
jgi:hypothetical protein